MSRHRHQQIIRGRYAGPDLSGSAFGLADPTDHGPPKDDPDPAHRVVV